MVLDRETCSEGIRPQVLRSMTFEADGPGIEPELAARISGRWYFAHDVPISCGGRG